MKIVPRPRPTAAIMKAMPKVMPAICGRVRRKPCVSPEDSSMTLFGPGVKNITTANKTKAIRSDCDMWHSCDLGQDLLSLRQQHDGDAAHHDDHSGKPQWPEPLAENDSRCRGADERHQQRERHHLRRGIVA